MLELLLGIILGVFIVTPLIIITLLCKFPFKSQLGYKKAQIPTTIPPDSHKGPFLYKLFRSTLIPPAIPTSFQSVQSVQSVQSAQSTQPTQSTQPAQPDQTTIQSNHSSQPQPQPQPQPPTLLDTTRSSLIKQLLNNGKIGDGSIQWVNLIIISFVSIFKQILNISDQETIKLCKELNISPSGTQDSYRIANAAGNDSNVTIGEMYGVPLASTNNNNNNNNSNNNNNNNNNNTNNNNDNDDRINKTDTNPSSIPTSSGSTTFLPLINRLLLQKLQNIPFLGPTRVTYLDIRSILPQINSISLIHYDKDTDGFVIDIDVSFATDSLVEVDLSADLDFEGLLIASVPAQVALGNVFISVNIRLAIDPGDIVSLGELQRSLNRQTNIDGIDPCNELPVPPSVSISLNEPPVVRFDLATSFGYNYWLTNLPFLHSLIHKAVLLGASSILNPHCQTIELQHGWYHGIVQLLSNMAVGRD
jgi:hypothetical protein